MNNNVYLNNSSANFSIALDRSTNLDCLSNLNDFRQNLIPQSSSLINSTDFQSDNNLKTNLNELGLFSNCLNENKLNEQLTKMDTNLVNEEELVHADDEEDNISIDVDGADECSEKQQQNEVNQKLNSIFEESVQKNLIKSLSINSDANHHLTNSIKNDLKGDLKSELKNDFKSNFKVIKDDQQKSILPSSLSSSSSSSTDTQYNINSFLYPHWLLSCTQ